MKQSLYNLPEKWEWTELGKVVTLINGKAYKKHELLDEGPVPVLRVGNFSNRSWYYSDLELPKDKYCNNGDLLYAWSASFGPKIWDGGKAIYHYHIWKIVLSKYIDKNYLYYLLALDSEEIKAQGNGIAMMHATKGGMEKRQIPLPPLAEQKKIAEILDAADSLRQKDQQLIEHYTSLSQSLFLDMFGDPVTNPKGYEQKTLLELTNKITDGTHHTPTYTESGVPFLRVTDVTESNDSKRYVSLEAHEELIKRCHPKKNDILYTKNGTIGVGKIVDWDLDFSIFVSLCLLKPKHDVIEVKYLNHFLNTPFAIRQAMRHSKEATIKNLHLVEIRKMKIPYPSREEQKIFVSKLEKIELQKQQAQTNLEKSEALFNSLIQRAFKGELMVSKAA